MKYVLKKPGKPIEVKEAKLTLELIQSEVDGMLELLWNPFGNDSELQMYMNEEALLAEDNSIVNFTFFNSELGYNPIAIYGNVVFLRFREWADAPEGLTDNQIKQLTETEELK